MKMSEIEKYYDNMKPCRVRCPKCDHSNTLPVFTSYKMCGYCGTKIINKTRARFKYMLRKTMKEMSKNGRTEQDK